MHVGDLFSDPIVEGLRPELETAFNEVRRLVDRLGGDWTVGHYPEVDFDRHLQGARATVSIWMRGHWPSYPTDILALDNRRIVNAVERLQTRLPSFKVMLQSDQTGFQHQVVLTTTLTKSALNLRIAINNVAPPILGRRHNETE